MNPAVYTAAYGLWLIGGGIYRHLETAEGSTAALGFGIFTGVLALTGAALFKFNKRLAGLIITGVAVLFVLGFFVTMTIKGTYPLNIRIGLTILFSVIQAVLMLTAKPKTA